ncbi:hypothetical protein [Micromonospora globbae]|uniref:hypothetical protein n=1 Tax=Micromonospora globbae TaxID=1894969 RepID=UPI003433DB14
MKTIDINMETAERALVVIAHHVPLTVDIGRPLVASKDGINVLVVTDRGNWWVRPGHVERVVELSSGEVELTRWSGRVELSRSIR